MAPSREARNGRRRSRAPFRICGVPPSTSGRWSASWRSGRCIGPRLGPAGVHEMVLAEMPTAGDEETGPFVNVHVTVNGARRSATVETRTLLVHFLRENLSLTGTHIGCDTTNCGACTILLDGKAVKSCTILAVQAGRRGVGTVLGRGTDGRHHAPQRGLARE